MTTFGVFCCHVTQIKLNYEKKTTTTSTSRYTFISNINIKFIATSTINFYYYDIYILILITDLYNNGYRERELDYKGHLKLRLFFGFFLVEDTFFVFCCPLRVDGR